MKRFFQVAGTTGVRESCVAAPSRLDGGDGDALRKFIDTNVHIIGGEVVDNNSIELGNDETVSVAIVFNVTSAGRLPAMISATQGNVDSALETAHELLEDWENEHYGEEGEDVSTETFEGRTWELSPDDFWNAIQGTDVARYLDVNQPEEDEEEDDEEEEEEDVPEADAKDILEGLGQYLEHEGHDAARESARIARLISGASNSEKIDKVLEEVDKLIDGSGVEAINGDYHVDNYYGDIVALYVNTGDSYAATLLYETENDKFIVTSFGDWVEHNERKYKIS